MLVAPAARTRLTIRSSSEWYDSTTIRPPTASASTAAGSARASDVELAVDLDAQRLEGALGGWPPVRRVAAGIEERTSSASRAVPVNGSRRALADDGVGDPPGEPLLAVLPQHPGQLARRSRC